MKAFRAYAKGQSVTALTARAAAGKFFRTYPARRKCNVTEGEIDGAFFVTKFTIGKGERPQSWSDVTKKTVETLPDVAICLTGKGEPIVAVETPREGTIDDRYGIYAESMRALGQPAKTLDEWLNS
jgi:hypothetical protein